MPVTDRDIRRLTIILVSVVGILIAYWSLWALSRGVVASEHTRSYYDFEDAFPVADAWLGICALMSIRSARLYRPTALLWTLCGGGAGIYLVSMDVLYDLEHGIYATGAGGAIELVVNAITISVSIWTLRWGWVRRHAILGWATPPPAELAGSDSAHYSR